MLIDLKASYPKEDSSLELKFMFIGCSMILAYFLWGIAHDGISIPGKSGTTMLFRGLSAWVMCSTPVVWFIGEYYLHSSSLDMNSSTRKRVFFACMVLIFLLLTAAVVLSIGPAKVYNDLSTAPLY